MGKIVDRMAPVHVVDDRAGLKGLQDSKELAPSSLANTVYLDRCQVDTPLDVVSQVWSQVLKRRRGQLGVIVDFGAGDARFAHGPNYQRYFGYEVDPQRKPAKPLPQNATVDYCCAFSKQVTNADVCIGNPPYVRNQDLPEAWDTEVAKALAVRSGVNLSGLSNAWQYFFLLALLSTKPDGLVALVIPYEWVSRPSVKALRGYIEANQWEVSVYRLRDETFPGVMTTASITIVDKAAATGRWQYFEERLPGQFKPLASPAASDKGVVSYLKKSELPDRAIYAKRGLSPGTQKALVLTEAMRAQHGLLPDEDVVACITSLKPIDTCCIAITPEIFISRYRDTGMRCWLINVEGTPSTRLKTYLDSVPKSEHDTATCNQRDEWWRFTMPVAPPILAATGFTGDRPKIAANECGARAVGSVAGIYGVEPNQKQKFIAEFSKLLLKDRIVPHSNSLRKVEINQMNALIQGIRSSLQLDR